MIRALLRRLIGWDDHQNALESLQEAVEALQGLAEEPTKRLAEWAEARQQLDRILKRFQAREQHDRNKADDDPMARARMLVLQKKHGGG